MPQKILVSKHLFYLFLLIAVFLLSQSIFAYDVDRISDADEEWGSNMGQADQSALNLPGTSFSLPNDALISRADEIWAYDFNAAPANVNEVSESAV
jgi:hypothetical protein